MKIVLAGLICCLLTINPVTVSWAAVPIPPLQLEGNKEQAVSLVLGSELKIFGSEQDQIYLDDRIGKVRLVAADKDFSRELKIFKKYRFQYAMFAGIIFAGLFFVVLNNK